MRNTLKIHTVNCNSSMIGIKRIVNLNTSSKILLTGGAGYIGTHTIVELYKAGYEVVVYDNLSNSNLKLLKQVESIVNAEIPFEYGDILDGQRLKAVFDIYDVQAVIHFAGLKAVQESVQNPLLYYHNNVEGTRVLLEVMKENGCKNIIFSSSATVYGDPEIVPIQENAKINPVNSYGRSKYFIEEMIKDANKAYNINYTILRYFNPIGAHESGLIGEVPNGVPNNLMPYLLDVATGKREYLNIYGDDYDTPDGTGIRDYIHVMDLANGHVKALGNNTNNIINLGTGRGYSVMEVVKTFEKVTNIPIKYKIQPRRDGDIAECFACTSKAKEILNWEAKRNLEDMCKDAWYFKRNNI